MNRLVASIKKEFLILIRDRSGLGLIFLMPAALVLVMTLIQDASFRKLDETKITLLYLDEDRDTLGIRIKEGLEETGYFELVTAHGNRQLDEKELLGQVARGTYQMGVVVKAGSTEAIRSRGYNLVQHTLMGQDAAMTEDTSARARIVIYFDPAIKASFKVTVRNALENFTSKIEAGILFQALSSELAQYLPEPPAPLSGPGGGIDYQEIYASDQYSEIIPNSVQHNVPAWSIFAMFFIIIPLTGNLIREKESGLATRLRLMPGNAFHILGAKIIVYLMVGMVQSITILLMGKLVFPLFSLPPLVLGPEKAALFLMVMATTLAATGYSVLVGTIARTHDQAAVFGMVSVIILAAIGGIWVPVFMMPDLMQSLSIISPLNWSLDGFYDILLRGAGVTGIAGNFSALIAFFMINLGAAVWINNITSRK
ncbi:MAG: ABC transporter permease [Bacteroidales bacterium]|jgi:ABC-2 type transport system permease protein|nr:ABC transporter permease [Bacteroidales bacterium]